MTFEPLALFNTKKEGVLFFGIVLVIFILHVSFIYLSYNKFTSHKFYTTKGVLQTLYQKKNKNNKSYHVLKIKTQNFIIYSTSWKKSLHVKKNDMIQFTFIPSNINFLDYLSKRFFIPVFNLHSLKKISSTSNKIQNFIKKQHASSQMQELFLALFLAQPINKEFRVKIQNFGISHLVAISGFHLSVLFGVLFFLISLLYKPLQDNFFPYRDRKFDISIFIFFILSGYLYLINFTPSFLRAFVMSVLGFILYIRHFKILSFFNLSLAVVLILTFFPALLFSVGFWFSVFGVFYIFLYLHHFKEKFSNTLHIIFINIWVFLGMVIPVHGIFSYISWQQFLAIPLSIVFVVFYPFTIFLHVIHCGDLLDFLLENMFEISFQGHHILINKYFVMSYMVLSVVSIFNRFLAVFVIFLGLSVFFM